MKKNQRNIQAILDLASSSEIVEGKLWYPTANQIAVHLAETYGCAFYEAVGVLSALSPRNKWSRNKIDAERTINAYISGGSSAALENKVCTFTSNKKKAITILEANEGKESVDWQDILDILSGAKLCEFANCIKGNPDITIDGHAWCIWEGCRSSLKDVPRITKKSREQIKEDYRQVALANEMEGFELQAITWVTYRRIHGIK